MMKDPAIPLATKASVASLDPRNVTLEAEYHAEVDEEKFYADKPLLWLRIMLDRSPMGHDDHLGFMLRAMLATRIFKRRGGNVKFLRDVEFSFGHNIS